MGERALVSILPVRLYVGFRADESARCWFVLLCGGVARVGSSMGRQRARSRLRAGGSEHGLRERREQREVSAPTQQAVAHRAMDRLMLYKCRDTFQSLATLN